MAVCVSTGPTSVNVATVRSRALPSSVVSEASAVTTGGKLAGVTAFEDAYATLVPIASVAVTLKVCEIPLVRSVITVLSVDPSTSVAWLSGLDETV